MAKARLMVLMVAASLVIMVTFASAGRNKADYDWFEKYRNLQSNDLSDDSYVELVESLFEHLDSLDANRFQKFKDEVTFLHRVIQLDLQLCTEMHLRQLWQFQNSYSKSFRWQVRRTTGELVHKCQDQEFADRILVAKLNTEHGGNEQLKKMVQLANFIDPAADGAVKNYYFLEDLSPGIIEYLIKWSEDNERPLQEFVSKSWFGSKEKFENFYKKEVADVCENLINATDKLYILAYNKGYLSATRDKRPWLNYRVMCEDINSKKLKELVYQGLERKLLENKESS